MNIKYQTLFLILLFAIFTTSPVYSKDSDFVVVIDAGHGGKDLGAMDNGAREKDINLGVALELGKMIEHNMKGVKVVYTRNDDTFKTLQQRADIANNAKGNLFISIHTNSVAKENRNRATVEGASVYTLGPNKTDNNMNVARRENSVIELEKDFKQTYKGFDPNKDESYIIFEMAQKKNLSNSIKFAQSVQKNLNSIAGRKDRGVHQAGFWVLWATSMPSVLVELDFICNPTSARFMTSEEGKEKLALSIYMALKDYIQRDKSLATTVKFESNDKPSITKLQKGGGQKNSTANTTPKNVKGANSKSRSGKNSKKNLTETIEEPVKIENVIDEPNDLPMLSSASRKENDKKHFYEAPKRKATGYGTRRRRNEAARETSDLNIRQVSAIPVNSEDNYSVKSLVVKEENRSLVVQKENTSETMPRKKEKRHSGGSKVQHLKTSYTILVLTSGNQLGVSDPEFKGLSPLSSYKENNIYKYIYGDFKSQADANKVLKTIKSDFPEAKIIQQYKNQ